MSNASQQDTISPAVEFTQSLLAATSSPAASAVQVAAKPKTQHPAEAKAEAAKKRQEENAMQDAYYASWAARPRRAYLRAVIIDDFGFDMDDTLWDATAWQRGVFFGSRQSNLDATEGGMQRNELQTRSGISIIRQD